MTILMVYLQKINASSELIYIFIRTILIFNFGLFLTRIASARFRLNTPIDFVLFIIMGSILGRGINGPATLVSTLVVSFTLVGMHRIFSYSTFYSHRLGNILKGDAIVLLRNGIIDTQAMKNNLITQKDLEEEIRCRLHTTDFSSIKEIRLERNGSISFEI